MTREDAATINKRVMAAFVGDADVALSLDKATVIVWICFICVCVWTDRWLQDCDPIHYPIEFVNACTLSGLPDHELFLKKGAPYLVMHNTSAALCNGTRIVYQRRVGKCLEVVIRGGERHGEVHYLPRLILMAKSATLPFSLQRIQFPLQPCFAMTVHKCQGQTMDRVGIFFTKRTWTHGLLYVAVSRVRNAIDCFIVGTVGESVFNFCSHGLLH